MTLVRSEKERKQDETQEKIKDSCSNNQTLPVHPHLHRAGHGAEGKHSGTVLDGGLTVEGSLGVHQEHSHLWEGREMHFVVSSTAVARNRSCEGNDWRSAHLAAVRFVHHKHVAPDLDPGGLPLAAAPPGEARQGLVVSAHPILALPQSESTTAFNFTTIVILYGSTLQLLDRSN